MSSLNTLTSRLAAAALAFSLAHSVSAQIQDDNSVAAPTHPVARLDVAAQDKIVTPPVATQTGRTVAIDPLVPILLLAGLGGVCGALCLYGASRRMRGMWLRAAAGGVLTATLINPLLLTEEREALQTEIVIVIDKSASQMLDGRAQATQQAYEQLISQLKHIQGANIRTIEIDHQGGDPDGQDKTYLFGALEDSLGDIPHERLGAVILLTDGQVHDIPHDFKLKDTAVPFHVLLSGREQEIDRHVVIDQAPRFGRMDKPQTIKYRVIDAGKAPDPDARVTVVISSEGKEIARQTVTPGVQEEITVDVARAGSNVIEITAEALAGELTELNNTAIAQFQGLRDSMNVLLISGAPDAGTRMWRDLVKSDPDSNLVQFTVLRPPERQDTTPLQDLSLIPFPTHEVFAHKLNEFDLVIFDHYSYDGLLPAAYLGNIANYVQNGGALLVVSGPDYTGPGSLYHTPLAAILPAEPNGPVSETPYRPHVNTLGQRHPIIRNILKSQSGDAQWGRWMRIINSTPKGGNVVMEGANNQPLLYLQQQQKGRVAMLMSDQAWLWARGYEGGGPYQTLFQGLSGWLTKAPEFEEESLKMTRKNGQVIIEQQTMADQGQEIILETPSGKTMTVMPKAAEPGLWRAVIPATEIGLYSARQAIGPIANNAFLNVGPAHPGEYINTLSTPDLLQPLVDSMPGAMSRMMNKDGTVQIPRFEGRIAAQGDNAFNGPDWMGVRISNADRLVGVSQTPLIPGWAGMLLIVGLMAGAWYREGDGMFKQGLFKKKTPQQGGPAL